MNILSDRPSLAKMLHDRPRSLLRTNIPWKILRSLEAFARMSVSTPRAGLTPLRGVQKLTALGTRIQLDIGSCRALGAPSATDFLVQLFIRNGAEIPVWRVIHVLFLIAQIKSEILRGLGA